MFSVKLRDSSPALAAVGFTVLSQEGGMLLGKARAFWELQNPEQALGS